VIAADETTLKVVKEDKAKCYMWFVIAPALTHLIKASRGADIPNIVLYDYHQSSWVKCA